MLPAFVRIPLIVDYLSYSFGTLPPNAFLVFFIKKQEFMHEFYYMIYL